MAVPRPEARTVLDAGEIRRALTRIAHEVLEHNKGPQDLVLLSAPGTQVAEFGQSLSTAQLQSMQSLATQIVSLMEMPW